MGITQAQTTWYGAGRPKKGPKLPPVEYVKKDTSRTPVHGELTITVDFIVIDNDYVSDMKVVEVTGDTTDKTYVNECIMHVFETIRKDYTGKSPGKNKVKVKFSLPVKIPAVY